MSETVVNTNRLKHTSYKYTYVYRTVLEMFIQSKLHTCIKNGRFDSWDGCFN